MVDNRSAGFMGLNGFNFKSGDASGMANAMSDEKMGQGGEYFAPEDDEEETNPFQKNEYVDRSAQLTGSLDSLSLLNAANIALAKKEHDKKLKEQELARKNAQKRRSKKNLKHLIDEFEKN